MRDEFPIIGTKNWDRLVAVPVLPNEMAEMVPVKSCESSTDCPLVQRVRWSAVLNIG